MNKFAILQRIKCKSFSRGATTVVDAEIIPSLAEPGNAGGAIAKKKFAITQI